MLIKIFKEFGRQSELKSLCRSEVKDFLNDNRLQDGTVKRVIELLGSNLPMITIKKKPYRAKNGDLMAFLAGYGAGGCEGDKLGGTGAEGDKMEGGSTSGSDKIAKARAKARELERDGEDEEGVIIQCKFLRKSYIGEGMIIKMGGKIKELKGEGRSFEQTLLALKRGCSITIRYVDDYNWGVL